MNERMNEGTKERTKRADESIQVLGGCVLLLTKKKKEIKFKKKKKE